MNYINMNEPRDLYNYMKKYIKYGFVSNNDNTGFTRKELNDDDLYDLLLINSYYLQKPEELVESGYGLCADQVELERDFFKQQGYDVRTFYSTYHNHTFLVYKDKDNKYVLFERTYKPLLGLNKFDSMDSLFKYYQAMQLILNKEDEEKAKEVEIMEYSSLQFGESFDEMLRELRSGNKVLQYKCR